MKHFVLKIILAGAFLAAGFSAALAAEFSRAWNNKNSSIVLDAYEYTPIDWSKLKDNERLVGFINKASDGVSPKYSCKGNKLCKVKWKRYVATRELYHTRKVLAKTLGMKWGAYHLARPGNPIEQAQHFLQFAKPDKDDLIALDIEHNDPRRWMSLPDAEIFAKYIKSRTGRYPILYTNHVTAKFIADNRAKLPLLSRLNLWYARYKPSIPGVFPMGNWKNYTLWQFSTMVNCNDRTCPRRINGAGNWIDVNVVSMPPAELKKKWPFAELQAKAVPLPTTAPAIASAAGSITMLGTAITKIPSALTADNTDTIKMADVGKVTVPTWRPGAVIVKRVASSPVSPSLMAYQNRYRKQFTAPSSSFQNVLIEQVEIDRKVKAPVEDLSDQI